MKKAKLLKGLKITGITVGSIAVLIALLNIIPPKKAIKVNPFIKGKDDKVMVSAHRGGGVSNPENTLKAYKAAANEFHTDILESDLWMTKDGHLVYNHDESVNRTSDIEILTGSDAKHKISDYTIDELKRLNMGYNFEDPENPGTYPYRNIVDGLDETTRIETLKANDLQIVEVQDLFETFYESHPNMLFIVEIKNGGEQGFEAANIIDDLLTNTYPNYKDRVVIGTFHPEIEDDLAKNHKDLLIGASMSGAAKFLITQMFGVNIFCPTPYIALQLPMSMYGLNLTRNTYIRRAHRRNIAVQYWTINDRKDMEYLIDKNVDAIMTDNPKLLNEVLNSK